MIEKIKSRKRFHKKEKYFVPTVKKCRGKIVHLTYANAEKTRQDMIRFDKNKYLRIYKCRWCHRFHLTSQLQIRK